MAINYQATGTPVTGTGAITVAWPAHEIDDVGLLIVNSLTAEAVSLSTANGFVELTGSPSIGANARLTVFWCKATSASMASPVVADPGDHANGAIVTFRGVQKSTYPINAYVEGTDADASTLTATGVTTDTAGCMIAVMVSTTNVVGSGNYSNWANANLSSCTEWLDYGSGSGSAGGIAAAGGLLLSPGACGDTTATGPARTTAFITIALLPEGGGGFMMFSS